MELRHHRDLAIDARHRLAHHRRHSLTRRLRARAFTTGLDLALAGGADPQSDPTLTLRAEHLASPHVRRQLAAGLRDAVARAEHPPRLSAAAPVARIGVLHSRDLLAEVADRLDSQAPAGIRGIAAVNLLLTDGTSPLWVRSEGDELGHYLEAVAIGLGG